MVKCLVKESVKITDSKSKEDRVMTNFYLQLDNGELIRVLPNSYQDKNGVKHSNFSVLNAIAVEKDKLPL